MPRTRESALVEAPVERVWTVVGDPEHFARWWPRVTRVEAVSDDAFTALFKSKRGVNVRVRYRRAASDPPASCAWDLVVDGPPFERVFVHQRTTATLAPEGTGTRVTLELDQRLKGAGKLGGPMVRRGARRQLREALAGIGRAA